MNPTYSFNEIIEQLVALIEKLKKYCDNYLKNKGSIDKKK